MVLALRFSTRADWLSGVESLEPDNLAESVSGDETWLWELDDVEEPEFERPFSMG